jgi:Ulp1 family protease
VSNKENIFKLDKLFFPVNVKDNHWFLICVYMREKRIQVFDSLPDKCGRASYIKTVRDYLCHEHSIVRPKCDPVFNEREWESMPCFPNDQSVPRQRTGKNNCGVYTCLFMDFLMVNLPLCTLKDRDESFYRMWLCDSILHSRLT